MLADYFTYARRQAILPVLPRSALDASEDSNVASRSRLSAATARADNQSACAASGRDCPTLHSQRLCFNRRCAELLRDPSELPRGPHRFGDSSDGTTRLHGGDLDAARSDDITLDDYLNEFARRLNSGWSGFTGTLEQLPPTQPDGVP